MASKRISILLVVQLLLTSWAMVGVVSATGEPSTTIAIQTPSFNNGSVTYVSQNPIFNLTATSVNNSSILYTEYEITKNGQSTTSNYTTPVTVIANHSMDIGLRYRSNSTSGLESWNSLDLIVDADSPTISLSSGSNNPLRYVANQSIFVTSSNVPLNFTCSDTSSGVANISGTIGATHISGSNSILSLSSSNLPLSINGLSPFTVDVSCSDNVNNFFNQTYTIILDDSNPTLTVQESGIRSGSCISGTWGLSVQSSDSHTSSVVQRLNNSSWDEVSGMIGVPSDFNDTITLRAIDDSDFNSSNQSWSVYVDSVSPSIYSSLNQTTLSLSASDSCGISSIQYRWETLDGQTLGWVNSQNPDNHSIPFALNGSIVRAEITTSDSIGNTASYTTSWVNTNGSSPYSTVAVQSDRIGSVITGNASFIVTPVGYQANASWELFVNNQSENSGNTTTQIGINEQFSNGDQVQIIVNTTDGLGYYSIYYWNYTVDSSNSHQISVSVTGQNVNNPGLYLGPTGRLVPATASDDSSGVGGSHASCSWDGTNWFQSSANAAYAPSTSSGAVQSYTFACRSVDLLGNEGPVTWRNGSVDLQSPILSLQPSSSETIGLGSTITVNMSDSNGINSGLLELTWTDGSSMSYSNISLGASNYSSTIGQLFTGLSDGTITANVYTYDSVGNAQSILGRTWSLNTSNPFISVALSGDYNGQFITNDSTSIILNPPSGGWAGLWINYSLTDSDGTEVFSGNVSSSTTLQPTSLPEGSVWLNSTTGDSLGRTQSQGWIYTVDNSNSHQVLISITGQSVNNSGLLLGPTGRLVPATASDDSSGVGGSHVSCTWDETNWFQSSSNAAYAPSTSSGAVQSYVFGCRSVDLLGNEGPVTWLNGTVDLQSPTLSLQPASSETIGLGSTIMVNMSDSNGIQSGLLELTWTNVSSTVYSNISLGNSNYSATIGQLFSGISDGAITANVYIYDLVGNSQSIISRTWNLNTSSPFISIALSGDYYGQFITNDSTDITLIPPSGGWNGLWINYSMTDSNGTEVFSGNVSSSTTLQPTSLPEGSVWLNSTTGDSLGRTQSQGWIYTVDSSNSQSTSISIIGSNISLNNVNWIGVGSQFYVSGVNDDSNGVGANIASCSWDESSWFNVGDGSSMTPITTAGTSQNHTLSCRNVDILGNSGPIVQLNASSDSILPSQSLTPSSGSYIAPSSSISVVTSDQSGIQYSTLNLSWTDGQSSWQQSVMIFSDNWSSSLSSIQSSLTDGTITASLYTIDNLGNEELISGQVWYLNTSQPLSAVSLSGSYVGTYVDENDFTIHLTPPTAGNTNGWAIYTLEHSNGSTITSGNVSSYTQISQTLELENGQIWLNVTSYDIFLRNQSQSWTYTVDTSVGTVPVYSVSGSAINQSGNPILGSSGYISITTLQDDVGGVGQSHARCSWDNSSWFTTSSNTVLTPQSTSGSVVSFTLGCSVVDLLGNIGAVEWINGSIDLINPSVAYSISSGSLLSSNSTFTVSCSDSNGCTVTQISVFFNNGSTSAWNSMSISGSNPGISLSSLLSTTSSGTVTFYAISNDQLGNTINQSSSSFQYLHNLPTLTTSINSINSGSYIDGNLTFTITPSSGWMTGINVSLSVEHSTSSTALYSGFLNQSLSENSFENLSEGQVWINSTICDLLSRCSNSTIQLFVDNTAPGNPSYSITNGHVYTNQSHLVQGSEQITLTRGSDSASGTSQTICNGSNGMITFSTLQNTVSTQSLVQSEDWSTVFCYSKDNVGNIGESIQITIRRDDTAPSISISDLSTSSVIVPSGWYNVSCTDNVLFANMYLVISSGSNTLYQMNSTGPISIRYGTISNLGSGGQLEFEITCSDGAENEQIDSRTLEWLPYLTPSTISVAGLQINGTLYVTDSGVVTLSNSRSDVYHEYRYILNGSGSNWITENSTSFNLDLGLGNDSKNLRLQVRVMKLGSSLSNTSYSSLMMVDLVGPSIEINSNPIISNGSIIDLMSSDYGVGVYDYVWSWDNGSTIQSSMLSDIILPSSTSTNSWLSIKGIDSLGTHGSTFEVSITRDLTPPVISVNNTNPGYIGPDTVITIEISESTGLSWSTIRINGTSGQSTLIANNVSSYQLTSTDYPSWIWNQSSVNIVVQTESNSEIIVTKSFTLNPDNVAPVVGISNSLSTNLHGLNSSNHSIIHVSRSIDTSIICVKVGSTLSNAINTNCLSESGNNYQYNRQFGGYVLVVNATDYAGNIQVDTFNLTHHTISPSTTSSVAAIVKPGDSQNYSYTSQFPVSVEIKWDGSQIQDQGGWFVIPSGVGSHTITVNLTDVLGLSSEQSWNVTLDGDHPSISLEGDFYSGSSFGTNTTLFINSSDTTSLISNITITVNSSSYSCQQNWNPISNQFSFNGTLSTIFSATYCPIVQSSNLPVTINISTTDSVGNSGLSLFSMNYHGRIASPTWASSNAVQGSNFVWSSNLSIHSCIQGPGILMPTFEIFWSGSSGIISNNSITEVASNGVITCLVSDMFGNNASGHLNITIDTTNPSNSFIWPSTSNGSYVKAGTSAFTLSAIDSETGISSILYCIDQSYCTPNLLTSGTISLPANNGTRTLFVSLTNGVGLRTHTNVTFILDDNYPSMELDVYANAEILNSVIYVGSSNPMVTISMSDYYCINAGIMAWDNASLSITNNSIQAIPSSATWLRIDAIDCAGHTSSSNYSIQRISQISPASILASANSTESAIISSSKIIHNGSISLLLTLTHPVDLNILCPASSPTDVVNCNLQNSNTFELFINSTDLQSNVQLEFSDNLGNSLTQVINISADLIDVNCMPQEHVLSNSTTLILPGTRSSIFTCTDNLAGVRSVGWLSQGVTDFWTNSHNNSWIAPPPNSSPATLIAVDEVGNIYTKSFEIVFDDQAPLISFSPISGISFEEKITRPDGQFSVSCTDLIADDCIITVTQRSSNMNQIISVTSRINTGNISVTIPSSNSDIRIDVLVQDAIGNNRTFSKLFQIDDTAPIVNLTPRTPNSRLALSSSVVPDDGIITLDNLGQLDINYSLSAGITITCNSQTLVYSGPIQSEYDLSQYSISSCTELTVEVSAMDHVENNYYRQWVFSVDFIQPSVEYYVDSSCSWNSGTHIDLQSTCDIELDIIDDVDQNLSTAYTLEIYIDGNIVHTQEVFSSEKINLANYPSHHVTLSITGVDLAGREFVSNSLSLKSLDYMTPKWNGLICTGNSVCGWNGELIAANTNVIVGVNTSSSEAPIIESNLIFENAMGVYNFNSNYFSAEEIPDGSYLLTLYFKDAAGREFEQNSLPFIYDNEAPQIEILESLSNGILNESTILSCDICNMVWRVVDDTDFTSTTNHGYTDLEFEQYSLSTSALGNNTIEIIAIDSFGRESSITYNSTAIKTSVINPIEDMIAENNLNVQCLESTAIDEIRQVTCLWKRTESSVEDIPIKVQLFVDQIDLRNVDIVIDKSGGGVDVIDARNGIITLSNIHHYTESFELRISDEYSRVKPINFRIIEHNIPWEELSFAESILSETDNSSLFRVIIDPPESEQEFHLLKRGFIDIKELFNCSSKYKFARQSQIPITISSDNCQIQSNTWYLQNDGSISLEVIINHTGIRDSLGSEISSHPSSLFNINDYSLIIEYQDQFGVVGSSQSSDLIIESSEIFRTEDNLPQFIESLDCPLGTNYHNRKSADGFLQSQQSAPLSECANSITDADNINQIIWSFAFIDGNNIYYSEIRCKSTYFPENWNFQVAIDADLCEPPSSKFPTGVFDVIIQPWIVDESIFARDQDSFKISSDGKMSKLVQLGDCSDVTSCQFLEYRLFDVVVSSSLNPVSEVENSRELVEGAQDFIGSNYFLLYLAIALISLIGVIYSIYSKLRSGRISSSHLMKKPPKPEDVKIDLEYVTTNYDWYDEVLAKIKLDFSITDEEQGDFLIHALNYDLDRNKNLSDAELRKAAEDWSEIRYSKLTVVELKKLLKSRGLTVSGNKATLIEKLLSND